MKIRNGFVSNSSSSSFVIYREDITEEDIEILLNVIDNLPYDGWSLHSTEHTIVGFTIMDNEELVDKLRELKLFRILGAMRFGEEDY